MALYHNFRANTVTSRSSNSISGRNRQWSRPHADWYPGTGGIKTSYRRVRVQSRNLRGAGGRRVIGVILGGHSVRSRVAMGRLLDLAADLARQPNVMVAKRQAPQRKPVAAARFQRQRRPSPPSLAAIAAAAMATRRAATLAGASAATPQTVVSAPHRRSAPSPAQRSTTWLRSPRRAATVAPNAAKLGIHRRFPRGGGGGTGAARGARMSFVKGKQAQICHKRTSGSTARGWCISRRRRPAACEEAHQRRLSCSVMPANVKVASR